MQKIMLLFLLSITFISCLQENKKMLVQNIIEIKETSPIDFSELIEIESLIHLKTPKGIPIGVISKVLFTKEKIIVFDKLTETILFFENDGSYISRINNKGKGPEEYLSIKNISISKDDVLNIVDNMSKKIWIYSFEGKLIGFKKTDGWPEDYIEKNNTEYLSIYSGFSSKNSDLKYLNIRDENGDESGYFPLLGFIPHWSERPTHFFEDGTTLYYHRHYDDNIYKLDSKSINIAYKIDFGKYTYPTEELLASNTPDNYKKILAKKKYIGNISNINLTSNYLYFDYIKEDFRCTYVQNLKTKANVNYDMSRPNEYGISVNPIGNDGLYFYSELSYNVSDKNIKKLNEKYNIELSVKRNKAVLIKYKYII